MRLNRKAQGMPWETIVGLIIMILGIFILIFVVVKSTVVAETKASEVQCEQFNAIRAKTTIKNPFLEIDFVPQVCKTIDKDIPEGRYSQNTLGVQQNMRDLTAKCWKQWLEGRFSEILSGVGFFESDEKTKCSICYTFNIKKSRNIDPFKAEDFDATLDTTVYFAEDSSDKCAPSITAYGGGNCMESCDGENLVEKKSNKCTKPGKTKCCVDSLEKNECVNKGGNCAPGCQENEVAYIYPKGWQCANKEEICCVKKDNYYSYRDYIQKYGGPGYFATPSGLIFDSEETYAITYASDVSDSFWTASIGRQLIGGEVARILITPLNDVSNNCFIQ